jgi:polyphosphate kinase 2 (PPK2 family)
MGRWKKLDRMHLLPPIVDEAEYLALLTDRQKQMLRIQQWCSRERCRIVIAVEGWDAAGKGGMIQRLTEKLDGRPLAVWSIGAPTPEEQGRHYLWRFWQKLPAPGEIAIFDRSWYGRVLVERIENYCGTDAWKRAYQEINEFERQLVDDGVRLVKLLMHCSAAEQKERIVDRIEKPVKRFKVTLEDFRNIAKREQYLEAFDDMLEHTDTVQAPWTVIATDYKWRARVEAIEHVVKTLSKGADLEPRPLDPAIAEAARKLWGWKPSKVKVGG